MALSLKDIAKPQKNPKKEEPASEEQSTDLNRKVMLPWMYDDAPPPSPNIIKQSATSETSARHERADQRDISETSNGHQNPEFAQQDKILARHQRDTRQDLSETIYTNVSETSARHERADQRDISETSNSHQNPEFAQQDKNLARQYTATQRDKQTYIKTKSISARHQRDINETLTRQSVRHERADQRDFNETSNNLSSNIYYRGVSLKILSYIFEKSKKNGTRSTGKIDLERMSLSIGSSVGSIRRTIFRFLQKKVILRDDWKKGRHSFVSYSLPDETFFYLRSLEQQSELPRTNFDETSARHERADQRDFNETISEKIISSSISSNYNTTNTRESVTNAPSYAEQVLPSEWRAFSEENFEGIDIDPISEIGFSETHLKQLFRGNHCTKEILQESIYRFAFDLSENNKRASIKSSALNMFMGVMRRQGEYAKPDNYKSPREIAAERRAKELLAENERIAKLRAETFEAEFNIWWNGLSQEEQNQISPKSPMGERHRTSKARIYYRTEILGEAKEPQ